MDEKNYPIELSMLLEQEPLYYVEGQGQVSSVSLFLLTGTYSKFRNYYKILFIIDGSS